MERNEKLLVSGDQKTTAMLAEHQAARKRLSHLMLAKSGELESGNVVKDFQRMDAELTKLTRQSAGYQNLKLLFEAGPRQLLPYLPQRGALIQFIRYKRVDFAHQDRQELLKGGIGQDHYAAFLLTHEVTKLVHLGPAKPIDAAILEWRAQVITDNQNPRAQNDAIRRLLWEPVEAALPRGIDELRIAPDGQLSLLPFDAIRLADGRYLIERFLVSYLSSGRNLITRHRPVQNQGPVWIVADPDYDDSAGSTALLADSSPFGIIPQGVTFPRYPSFRSEAFWVRDQVGSLPDPRPEIVLKLGAEATEESLCQLDGPLKLLHFATHGKYFPERKRPPRPAESRDDNPLLAGQSNSSEEDQVRSLLALAGAGVHARRAARGLSDGLLTAFEVEGLKIWGTDLVILSLCESAVGEVINGEDMLGLRHAFQLAGARTVVASLWTVPDESTRKLMERFLKHWVEGMPKAKALRQAKLDRLPDLKAASFDGRSAPPADWAGFNLHGDPD